MNFNLFKKEKRPGVTIIDEKGERIAYGPTKSEQIKEISEWVNKRLKDWDQTAFGQKNGNDYIRPYTKGFNAIAIEGAFQELQKGNKKPLSEMLDTMIEKAIAIDPSFPDIKEMQGLRGYLYNIDKL